METTSSIVKHKTKEYSNYLPDDGKRKKAVVRQTLSTHIYRCGVFEQIKAAVLYALIRSDALTLVGSAAHGGSRYEAKSVSTK